MDDIDLIIKARKGCSDSFGQLIKSRKEKLYKIAFCYVKNEALALDIISETSYKGYVNIKKLKNPEYFDSWIGKILINEALGLLRKNKNVIYLNEYQNDLNSKENNIEEKLDLYEALNKISLEEKDILILKYFGDYTFLAIARLLGKSESTIKSKHYRALDKVKLILEGEE